MDIANCDHFKSFEIAFCNIEFPLTNPLDFLIISPLMATSKSLIPVERIEKSILLIRGHKVMLDSDLAELYGVTTARLNEQVRRNKERFPKDFGFQLIQKEFEVLMSQFATSKSGSGGRRKLPWVFTEHGILMLSSVLDPNKDTRLYEAMMQRINQLNRVDERKHENLFLLFTFGNSVNFSFVPESNATKAA